MSRRVAFASLAFSGNATGAALLTRAPMRAVFAVGAGSSTVGPMNVAATNARGVGRWCLRPDSNRRLPPYEGGVLLPTELRRHGRNLALVFGLTIGNRLIGGCECGRVFGVADGDFRL